jgi:hypothetical protein
MGEIRDKSECRVGRVEGEAEAFERFINCKKVKKTEISGKS